MSVKSKLLKFTATLSTLAISSVSFAGDFAGAYSVELNKTEIVRLSEPASAVIIGNPKIADVSVHSSDTVFVLGRGYGQTNLIVLNSSGETILNADIQVVSSISQGNVRLYNGQNRATYSCSPYCLPSPVLGDSVEFVVLNTPETREISTTSITGSNMRPSNMVGISMEQEPDFSQPESRSYYPE